MTELYRVCLRAPRRLAGLLAAGILLATALTVGPAQAAGEQGRLLVKGPGSNYAGSNALVSLTTTAGNTAKFGFKVRNIGTSEAQFRIHAFVYQIFCGTACDFPETTVTYGSLATKLAGGSNGYYTPPIAAGGTTTFSFNVKLPANASQRQIYNGIIRLYDTSGTQLDEERVDVNVKATTGTSAFDQFVTGAGSQPPAGARSFGQVNVTNPSVNVGGSNAYKVKLTNNSAAPAQIRYHLLPDNPCTTFYQPTVKKGTTNVTTAALNNTYATPVLQPGNSVTLTVTMKYISTLSGCGAAYSRWRSISHNGVGGSLTVHLVQNPAVS